MQVSHRRMFLEYPDNQFIHIIIAYQAREAHHLRLIIAYQCEWKALLVRLDLWRESMNIRIGRHVFLMNEDGSGLIESIFYFEGAVGQ